MVSSRKRTLREIEPEADTPAPPKELGQLQRIRNTWQFANLFQWIYLFGKVAKIDESIDIDDLEAECLKPRSTVLVDIGLALLKLVSSHRGLTPAIFDEYTRRQYVARAPEQNPFGTDETPSRFDDFDAVTKIRVLQQLTQWVMLHPERIREKMEEQKPSDQTEWRIEPTGWDSDDRTYYILDDNRLYRMTQAPPAPTQWKPKKNSKKAKAAVRAAKRRRVSRSTAQNDEDVGDEASDAEEAPEPEDDGFGGAKWECIGTSLEEVQNFLATLRKTRDDNEKILRGAVENHLLPILEKQEESRKRKALQREKELLNLEKLAHAKRSSRLANKAEQQKVDEQAKEEEQRRRLEEAAARKEEQKRKKIEKERDHRMMSREQRLRERETRRLQHEEELAQLSEDSKKLSAGGGRLSERRLKVEIEKNKQALQELEEEEEDWIFDCVCGVYGQVDDGTHSVACERCNIWQHSKCVGISEEEADREDFHFICKSCQRERSAQLANPKSTIIKVKANRPDDEATDSTESPTQQQSDTQRSDVVVEISAVPSEISSPSSSLQKAASMNASQLEPTPQLSGQPSIPIKQAGPAPVLLPPSPYINGDGSHPFSSPHPTLSPPEQSPNKSRAYSTVFNSSSPVAPSHHRTGESKLPQKGVFHVSPSKNSSAKRAPSNSLPPHADAPVPSVAAKSDSPLKQPFDAASNNLTVISPPGVSFSSSAQTPTAEANTPTATFSTPQLNKSELATRPDMTPTLPPTRNGLSPLKRSPPPAQQSSNGLHSSPAAAIFPPIAALSPSPSQQILTSPIKPADPARPPSQQSSSFPGDV